jgi:thiol:disulfide interchange protein DsbD
MRRLIYLFLLLPGLACAAASNTATTARDSVSLVSATSSAQNGTITLGLKFLLRPGWHIYWSNPGDAGLAPQITIDPPGSAGPFIFPPPSLLVQDSVAAYVLSGDVLLPFTATGVGNSVAATATWLVCADICVPEHAHFTLVLNGGPSAETSLFATPLVVPSPFASRIAPDGTLSVIGPTSAQVKSARFFPDASGVIINHAPQPLAFTATGLSLQLPVAMGFDDTKPLTGVLELTDASGAMQALLVSARPGPALSTTPLVAFLGLAFLGGLILNLMPCVFPILAMKVLAITRLGGAHKTALRREALGYTAGVLIAFLLLAGVLLLLRALGAAVGWGYQLQSPVFVALMALLILAAGLSLAGVFEIAGIPGIGNLAAGRGSFFTGLLAVAVATPCTAPFMGGAIAAALAAPPAAAFGIFLCLGLGLSAPFLLFAAMPSLGRLLPRPGRWMILLQRALSLPMFATGAWLFWVLFHQIGAAATPLTLPDAAPFSEARLESFRAARQPVFIDMTAAWCVTCLVNERDTLTIPEVQAAFAEHHVNVLVGDWTNRNPEITAYLQENQRDGVPLYVYYPANGAPVILPQILTPGIVKATINAGSSQTAQMPAPGG